MSTQSVGLEKSYATPEKPKDPSPLPQQRIRSIWEKAPEAPSSKKRKEEKEPLSASKETLESAEERKANSLFFLSLIKRDLEGSSYEMYDVNSLIEKIGAVLSKESTTLTLTGYYLGAIPEWVYKLTDLTVLELGEMGLTTLSPDIKKLVHLKTLNMRTNPLKDLSPLSELPSLESLDISETEVSSLPAEFEQLTRLKILRANRCDFSRGLPSVIFRLHSLQELSLSHAKIKDFPFKRGDLDQLRALHLNGNDFSKGLPFSPSLFPQLESLGLSRTKLKFLPGELGDLTQLKKLLLSHNPLNALPDWVSNLTCLELLDVENNQIQTIPISLASLSHCTILAEKNPLSLEHFQAFNRVVYIQKQQHPENAFSLKTSFEATAYEEGQLTPQEQIDAWISQFRILFPEELVPEMRGNLCLPITSAYLTRLAETAEYQKENPPKQLIFETVKALILAQENSHFSAIFSSYLDEALSDCADRVTWCRTRIEIYRNLHNLPKKDLPSVARLLVGFWRLELVEELAKAHIQAKGLGDHIETMLFFYTSLAKSMHLPFSTNKMISHEASGISQEELRLVEQSILDKTSSREDIQAALIQSDIWGEILEKTYPHRFKSLIDYFSHQLERESGMSSSGQAIRERAEELKKALEKEKEKLTTQLTEAFLSEHFPLFSLNC